MAKIVESFPVDVVRRGRPRRHDWSEVLDGRPREFSGDDFPGTASDFGRQVRRAASLRGVRVRVSASDLTGVVYVQRIDD